MKLQKKTYFNIIAGLFILYLCIHYWPSVIQFVAKLFSAATPLWLGCAIAYVLNILMSFYERHYFPKQQTKLVSRSRRPVCLIGSMLTLITIIALVISLVVPQLISCLTLVFSELPSSIERLIKFLSAHEILPKDIASTLASVDWQSRITQIVKPLISGVGNFVNVVVLTASSLISGVTTAVFAFIFTIYLLSGKERLARQSRHVLSHYLRKEWYEKLMYVLSVLNDSFHRFIVGQCTEAVILGGLCTVGMLILRLPYAPMIGALIAFTSLIPVVGAFIGGALGAFLIVMESPVQALIFLIFLVILQQLEGNLIYPRVVGTSIGLPAIWVLAVVTTCGGTFGILGILIGIPVAAAAYRLIYNNMNKSQTT